MVFSTGPLEFSLKDADRFWVIVDALDDRCLVSTLSQPRDVRPRMAFPVSDTHCKNPLLSLM